VLAVVSTSSTATRRLLIGRPLPKRIALPVFASDAVSSVAKPHGAPGDARRGFPE